MRGEEDGSRHSGGDNWGGLEQSGRFVWERSPGFKEPKSLEKLRVEPRPLSPGYSTDKSLGPGRPYGKSSADEWKDRRWLREMTEATAGPEQRSQEGALRKTTQAAGTERCSGARQGMGAAGSWLRGASGTHY